MTYANNLGPDEAPQNVGLHLRSKLFDIQIIYQQKHGWKQWIFWKFWKKQIFEKITKHAKSYNVMCSVRQKFWDIYEHLQNLNILGIQLTQSNTTRFQQ